MSVEIVNPVPVSDVEPWTHAFMTTILGDPANSAFPAFVERWQERWDPDRFWAARSRGRFVGTLGTEVRTLTVPAAGGGTVDTSVDALTGVTVAATHRRQGILTSMLGGSLRSARDRGDALSVLIAAEWPIYGHFGYGPAVRRTDITYRIRGRGAGITPSPDGTLRQVDAAEVVDLAPAIFDRARRLRAGQIDRAGSWWQRSLNIGYRPIGKASTWLVHEGADGPDGLLGWRVTRDFELDGTFGAAYVTSLVAAGDGAYRNLWAYLGSLDLIDEVHVPLRPVDEPARFLVGDGRVLVETSLGDFLWVRVLDVPAALTARGYGVPDRLVLEVVDPTPDAFAAGRFALDSDAAGATCTPTTRSADLTLPATALGAAYLGGHALSALRVAGGIDEHTPGALRRLDTMLSAPLAPWCQTGF